jgi:hypothetical protein
MVNCLSFTSASPAGPLSQLGAAPDREGVNDGPLVTAAARIGRRCRAGAVAAPDTDTDTG